MVDEPERPAVSPKVRNFLEAGRVARLATADADGSPHVIPVCYVYLRGRIYTALDRKPKRVEASELKRVRNIVSNPRAALVVDEYSEDWRRLGYVLVRGPAALLGEGEERTEASDALRRKYPQYVGLLPEDGLVIRITPERVASWGDLSRQGAADPAANLAEQTEE